METSNVNLIYAELSKIYMKFIYEPEHMSCSEIEECIMYFLDNFIDSKYSSKVNTKVNIIRDLYDRTEWGWIKYNCENYKIYKNINFTASKCLSNIDEEIYNQINYKEYLYFHTFECPLQNEYNIGVQPKCVFAGILKNKTTTSLLRLYLLLTGKVVLKNKKNIKFWNFYKKFLNLYAITYNASTNSFDVRLKPEELILGDNFDLYYRNGNQEFCFWEGGRTAVPIKIYKTKIEDLNLDDLLLLKTNSLREMFFRRNNIVALAKFGEIIDTYENYPDNEMWAKSEYKIIDMYKIVPAKSITNWMHELSGDYTYAPFLYMKNQTTGEYHLEGLHPRCKTLYDAIKMRYNGLNIKDYDIKDIK